MGVPEGQRPTDAQFVQLLMLSLLGMAWFNSERMLEWAAEARGAGWAAGWDAAEAEAAALPCSKKEGLAFARWLVKNGPGFKKPSMFTGCGNRAQGSGPWSDALHAWLTPADAEAGPASLRPLSSSPSSVQVAPLLSDLFFSFKCISDFSDFSLKLQKTSERYSAHILNEI